MMCEKMFMKVKEVVAELEVPTAYAYKLMRELNKELKKRGSLSSPDESTESISMRTSTEPNLRKERTPDACLQEREERNMVRHGSISDLKQRCDDAEREAATWKQRYMQKAEQTQIFTNVMRQDPERTQALLRQVAWPKLVNGRTTVDRVHGRRQDAGAR